MALKSWKVIELVKGNPYPLGFLAWPGEPRKGAELAIGPPFLFGPHNPDPGKAGPPLVIVDVVPAIRPPTAMKEHPRNPTDPPNHEEFDLVLVERRGPA